MANKIYIPTFVSDQNYTPARVNPRVFFYNGTLSCEPFLIEGIENSTITQTSVTAFPYFDHYSSNKTGGTNPGQDSDSLLFLNESSVYGVAPTSSLYDTYWEKYVSLLYDPKTRLLDASAIIALGDYNDMELNDIVQFRGNYFHLRAINDYDVKTGTCNIQLLGPILDGSLTFEQKTEQRTINVVLQNNTSDPLNIETNQVRVRINSDELTQTIITGQYFNIGTVTTSSIQSIEAGFSSYAGLFGLNLSEYPGGALEYTQSFESDLSGSLYVDSGIFTTGTLSYSLGLTPEMYNELTYTLELNPIPTTTTTTSTTSGPTTTTTTSTTSGPTTTTTTSTSIAPTTTTTTTSAPTTTTTTSTTSGPTTTTTTSTTADPYNYYFMRTCPPSSTDIVVRTTGTLTIGNGEYDSSTVSIFGTCYYAYNVTNKAAYDSNAGDAPSQDVSFLTVYGNCSACQGG